MVLHQILPILGVIIPNQGVVFLTNMVNRLRFSKKWVEKPSFFFKTYKKFSTFFVGF